MRPELLAEVVQAAQETPQAELPALLGRLVEAEAHARLRLAEAPVQPAPAESRLLDADQAAAIVGVSRRSLLAHTKGMKFRCDLSRKRPLLDEAGLNVWLKGRRR